jgi:hypothetical protein
VGCRQSFQGITSPEFAEALALRHAVTLALDEGFHKVLVQSDCLSVIKNVNASERNRSGTEPIVADIKSLSTSFETVSFIM